MRIARWWQVAKDAASEWLEDKASRLGAALAYYTVFSIAPLLVIIIAFDGPGKCVFAACLPGYQLGFGGRGQPLGRLAHEPRGPGDQHGRLPGGHHAVVCNDLSLLAGC